LRGASWLPKKHAAMATEFFADFSPLLEGSALAP
jgi:hypothetical protein